MKADRAGAIVIMDEVDYSGKIMNMLLEDGLRYGRNEVEMHLKQVHTQDCC